MNLTDEELIQELVTRLAQSRKAFSDLSIVNKKLLDMNRKLELSESLKSNFLSNIRNEINNPLNAIIGIAGQLAGHGQDVEDVATLASMICSEACSLDFQMRNIFMAAELEAGEAGPHITRTDVAALLRDVADSFRHNAAQKSVVIELDLPEVGPPLLFATDAEKLQIIVSNLLANGIEYSFEGGTVIVTLKLDSEEGWLLLSVRDHGVGIPEEEHKRIFDRFTQLDSGSTRLHLGQGLGLSITRGLTDLLQGTITVESMKGQGALFTVTLPPISVGDDDDTFADGGNLFLFDESCER